MKRNPHPTTQHLTISATKLVWCDRKKNAEAHMSNMLLCVRQDGTRVFKPGFAIGYCCDAEEI